MDNARVFKMKFGKIYPMLVAKAEKKGRTKEEVDEVIYWLLGYTPEGLQQQLEADVTTGDFFENAPQLNPNASLITGVVYGVRVEEIEDETMQKIRYLDKLVDELAKGKPMEKILRA